MSLTCHRFEGAIAFTVRGRESKCSFFFGELILMMQSERRRSTLSPPATTTTAVVEKANRAADYSSGGAIFAAGADGASSASAGSQIGAEARQLVAARREASWRARALSFLTAERKSSALASPEALPPRILTFLGTSATATPSDAALGILARDFLTSDHAPSARRRGEKQEVRRKKSSGKNEGK